MLRDLPAPLRDGPVWEGGPRGFSARVRVREDRVEIEFRARSPAKAASGVDSALSCARVSEELLNLVRSD